MAKAKKVSAESKGKKVTVGIYPEESEKVLEKIKEELEETDMISPTELNSRDIRAYFDLKPTHRGFGVKRQIAEELKDLSDEEQQEILSTIKKGKGE